MPSCNWPCGQWAPQHMNARPSWPMPLACSRLWNRERNPSMRLFCLSNSSELRERRAIENLRRSLPILEQAKSRACQKAGPTSRIWKFIEIIKAQKTTWARESESEPVGTKDRISIATAIRQEAGADSGFWSWKPRAQDQKPDPGGGKMISTQHWNYFLPKTWPLHAIFVESCRGKESLRIRISLQSASTVSVSTWNVLPGWSSFPAVWTLHGKPFHPSTQNQRRIQDCGQGGQRSFDPRGALSPKFAQNREFFPETYLKTAWFWKKSWGQGGPDPQGPQVCASANIHPAFSLGLVKVKLAGACVTLKVGVNFMGGCLTLWIQEEEAHCCDTSQSFWALIGQHSEATSSDISATKEYVYTWLEKLFGATLASVVQQTLYRKDVLQYSYGNLKFFVSLYTCQLHT